MYTKPVPGEYGSFYQRYFDQLPDAPILDLLGEQPVLLRNILSEFTEATAELPYAPGKWSTKQVLGHLMDTERVMCYRAMCISRGEQQSLPGFAEEMYVSNGGFNKRLLGGLLEEYEQVRQGTLLFFQNLEKEAVQRWGTANNFPVTVNALAGIIAAHERHHLNLFSEKYLPILRG